MMSHRKGFAGFVVSSLVCAGAVLLSEEPPSGFAELQDLKPPVLFPENAKLSVNAEGNYCVNGKPRFLIGAQIDEKVKSGIAPTQGYPKSLAWLYEDMLDYGRAQRVGLDSVGYFIPDSWIHKYAKDAWLGVEEAPLTECLRGIGLPLYVDFTCAPWSQGKLATPKYKNSIPPEALNAGGYMAECNHWVPYSANHPEGRKMYEAMWRAGAEHLKASGAKACVYELFNEPAYNDPSKFNRELFSKRMKERYGSIDKLNADWRSSYKGFDEIERFKSPADNPALFVEWCKFMEDSFVDLCKLGVSTIRAVDPEARFCVQVMGGDMYRALPRSNVNLCKLSAVCDGSSTGTGGGLAFTAGLGAPAAKAVETPPPQGIVEGMLHRRFILSISRGKPVQDGEMYSGATKGDMERGLWLELMRGGDAAYLFKWTRRSWDSDWKPAGSPEGGRKVAEKFPYLILNPFGIPPETLTGIMAFKRELMKVDDLFVPRERNVPAEVALLLSFPTVRYSAASGSLAHHEILPYASALEFSHRPYDVLLEEQLAEGRQSSYKAIVAPGVRNIYAESAGKIRSFVENGGTLILGREAMELDEHGNKIDWNSALGVELGKELQSEVSSLDLRIPQAPDLPGSMKCRIDRELSVGPGWSPLGYAGGAPRVFMKKLGKGKLYFIGLKMPDYSLASALGGILEAEGIGKPCSLLDAASGELEPNVEMHMARRDGRTGLFLLNWDAYPKLAKLKFDGLAKEGAALADPLAGEELKTLEGGSATVLLPPKERVVLVCGDAKALAERYGSLKPVNLEGLRGRMERIRSEAKAKAPVKKEEPEFSYQADLSKMKVLDLRPFANRHFEDGVAGDGKGGWTDQGAENSLRGVPWGMQKFCGVPFEIIRFDENGNRACIVLASQNSKDVPLKVAGIPVGDKAKAIYFLHATAWSDGSEAFRYVVNYADGSKDIVPVRCGSEVGDWWLGKPKKGMAAHEAWSNSERRGFYAYRWESPHPEKTVQSVDIESANNAAIPIVVAISVENP